MTRSISAAIVFALLLFSSTPARADWHAGRPDSHAPLGVMGDHTHKSGEWMSSYRYMRMHMGGNRIGTRSVPAQTVTPGAFMVAPLSMDMDMHMLGLMYAPTDDVTVMAMLPVLRISMDHVIGANGRVFTTDSQGLGDVSLTALWSVLKTEAHRVHLHAGVALPTGETTVDAVTPASAPAEVELPYPMRPGSGSLSLLPGITYMGQGDLLSWGVQVTGKLPLYKNEENYRLGNSVSSSGWIALAATDWLSTSARVAGEVWGNIDGNDPGLAAGPTVPTKLSRLRGGERVDLWFGINLLAPEGVLAGHRIALEAGFPAYQSLDGPQLETDWQLVTGWQKAW